MEEIPHQLIINWDQTPFKLTPSSNWTMKKCGTEHVEKTTVYDKSITGVFGCTLAGDFLTFIHRYYKEMPSENRFSF